MHHARASIGGLIVAMAAIGAQADEIKKDDTKPAIVVKAEAPKEEAMKDPNQTPYGKRYNNTEPVPFPIDPLQAKQKNTYDAQARHIIDLGYNRMFEIAVNRYYTDVNGKSLPSIPSSITCEVTFSAPIKEDGRICVKPVENPVTGKKDDLINFKCLQDLKIQIDNILARTTTAKTPAGKKQAAKELGQIQITTFYMENDQASRDQMGAMLPSLVGEKINLGDVNGIKYLRSFSDFLDKAIKIELELQRQPNPAQQQQAPANINGAALGLIRQKAVHTL
jgi:hypothetical protein